MLAWQVQDILFPEGKDTMVPVTIPWAKGQQASPHICILQHLSVLKYLPPELATSLFLMVGFTLIPECLLMWFTWLQLFGKNRERKTC